MANQSVYTHNFVHTHTYILNCCAHTQHFLLPLDRNGTVYSLFTYLYHEMPRIGFDVRRDCVTVTSQQTINIGRCRTVPRRQTSQSYFAVVW